MPVLNLQLTVRTMTRQTVTAFDDGNLAITAIRAANEDPFTTQVILTNVVDGQEVLVWSEVQDLPRWVTGPVRRDPLLKQQQLREAYSG